MTSRESNIQEGEQKFFEFIGLPYPYQRPPTKFHPSPDLDKILSLSDLHVPYEHNGALNLALSSEANASVVVVPGDLGDYYSKSRFKKNRAVSFKDEVRAVFLRLEWLANHWPSVKIMVGNHDDRPEKTIGALFNGNESLLIMTEPNLLKYLASYFDNIEVVGHRIEGLELTHIYQHGDIAFTHAEISRAQKTATLEYISNYLRKWEHALRLKPWKILAQGHNHSDLKTSRDGEKWFMLPTCSDPYSVGMEYIYSSRMIGSPPAIGYTVFMQHGGVTNYNLSHNIVIDYAD
jgi:predicted phosphodiesterase